MYRPPGLEVSVQPEFQKNLFRTKQLLLTSYKVPERVLRTVRVSVASNEQERHGGSRVRIGILVCGSQDGFEHVRRVTTRNYIFTENDQVIEVWRISNTRLGCVTFFICLSNRKW